jgi:hypothetical protein
VQPARCSRNQPKPPPIELRRATPGNANIEGSGSHFYTYLTGRLRTETQSYILGRLRNVTFFSLAECNAAIAGAVEQMNGREMRRLGMSRRQLFETVERPLMQGLPQNDYEYAEWLLARVGIDYHVEGGRFDHAGRLEQVFCVRKWPEADLLLTAAKSRGERPDGNLNCREGVIRETA